MHDETFSNSAFNSISEAKLYGRFIKYIQLNKLCSLEFPNPITEVNVFIDFSQLIMPLYKFNDIIDPFGVLATMVNMPLHYRNFFKKCGIKSNIFVIYSSNDSSNSYRFISGYNNKNISLINSSPIKSVIDHNIELMKTLFPYIPGVYLKLGTVEPTVIAADLIDKFTRNGLDIPSIFITCSEYSFQLPTILPNTKVFFKKSTVNKELSVLEDTSFSFNYNNALFAYILRTKKKDTTNNDTFDIPQSWVSPFMILTGLQCRDVKGLFNYSQAIKILSYIKNTQMVVTPESIYNAIVDTAKKNVFITKEEIASRYCAIDIAYQLKLYRELPESIESSFLKDLNDPQALYDIVNTYFGTTNPIDLSKI